MNMKTFGSTMRTLAVVSAMFATFSAADCLVSQASAQTESPTVTMKLRAIDYSTGQIELVLRTTATSNTEHEIRISVTDPADIVTSLSSDSESTVQAEAFDNGVATLFTGFETGSPASIFVNVSAGSTDSVTLTLLDADESTTYTPYMASSTEKVVRHVFGGTSSNPVLTIRPKEKFLRSTASTVKYIVTSDRVITASSGLQFTFATNYWHSGSVGAKTTLQGTGTIANGQDAVEVDVATTDTSNSGSVVQNVGINSGSDYTLGIPHTNVGVIPISSSTTPVLTIENINTNNAVTEGDSATFRITSSESIPTSRFGPLSVTVFVGEHLGLDFIDATLSGGQYQVPDVSIPNDGSTTTAEFSINTKGNEYSTDNIMSAIVNDSNHYLINRFYSTAFVDVNDNGISPPRLKITTTTKAVNEGDPIPFRIISDKDVTGPVTVTLDKSTGSTSRYVGVFNPTAIVIPMDGNDFSGTLTTIDNPGMDGDGVIKITISSGGSSYVPISNLDSISIQVFDKQTPRPTISVTSTEPASFNEGAKTSLTYSIATTGTTPMDGFPVQIEVLDYFGDYVSSTDEGEMEITIDHGSTSKNHMVGIRDADSAFGPHGQVGVAIRPDSQDPPRYIVSTTNSIVTSIIQDTMAPANGIYIFAGHDQIMEGETARFQIARSSTGTAITSFNYSVNDAAASFFETGYNFTQSVGMTTSAYTANLDFATEQDTAFEANQEFEVTLLSGTGYTLVTDTARTKAKVTILDDDAPANVSIIAVTASIEEGEPAKFQLRIGSGTFRIGSITIATSLPTGANFLSSPTTSVTPSSSNGSAYPLNISTVNDRMDEADATLTVTITSINYQISTTHNSASVLIRDNDVPIVTVTASSTGSVVEGNPAVFQFTTDIVPYQALTVEFCASDGTSTNTQIMACSDNPAGQGDVIVTPVSVSFVTIQADNPVANAITVDVPTDNDAEIDLNGGQIHVKIVYEDSTSDKTLAYSSNSGSDSATVDVSDNDPELTLSASVASVTEGDEIVFTITSNDSTGAAQIDFQVDLTETKPPVAQNGEGFLVGGAKTDLRLNIPAGSSSYTHTVQTKNFPQQTGDGSITMEIRPPSGTEYFLGMPHSLTVPVQDADFPEVEIEVDNENNLFIEEGDEIVLIVRLDAMPSNDVIVTVTIVETGDYIDDITGQADKMVTFTSGTTDLTQEIRIQTEDDSGQGGDEPDGLVTATIKENETQYRIGEMGSVRIRVRDNDGEPTQSVISISGPNSITEGQSAEISFQADPEPPRDLMVAISVVQSQNFVPFYIPRFVTIGANQDSASLDIPTRFDIPEYRPGTITVSVIAGGAQSGYMPHSDENNRKVVVDVLNDGESPPDQRISIASAVLQQVLLHTTSDQSSSEHRVQARNSVTKADSVVVPPVISVASVASVVDEGSPVQFRFNASRSVDSRVRISISIRHSAGIVSGALPTHVELRPGDASVEMGIPTVNDGIAGSDREVSVTIQPGTGYTVADTHKNVNVVVSDAADRAKRGDRIQQSGQVLFSEILGSLSTATLSATTARMDQAFQPESKSSVTFGGATEVTEMLRMGGESLNNDTANWKKFFGNSSFSLNLSADQVVGGGPAFWGIGNHREITGTDDKHDPSLAGELFTGHFGLDSGIGDGLVFGMSTSVMESEFEYGTDVDDRLNFETRSVSLYPYIGMATPSDNARLQIVAGYGKGETLLIEEKYRNETLYSDFFILGIAGSRQLLVTAGSNGSGSTELSLNGESWQGRQNTSGIAELTPDFQTDIGHSTASMKLDHSRNLSNIGVLSPLASLGIWNSNSNGESDFGMELAGSSTLETPTGWSWTASGNTLLTVSKVLNDWQSSLKMDFDENSDGLGFTMTASSTWQQINSENRGTLWQSDLLANDSHWTKKANGVKLETTIGYGVNLADGFGTLTPFTKYTLAESNQSEYQFGSRYSFNGNTNLEVLAIKRPAQHHRDNELKLNGSVGW